MRRVVAHLRGEGIKVWVDNERLIPGTPIWEEEIEKAIKGAFAIVVVLSPDAKNSEWVRREITLADQFHKRVFPVLVAGNDEDSIPLRLITRQFVDIRKNEAAGLTSLSVAISFYQEELESQEKKEREEAEKLSRSEEEQRGAAKKLKAERLAEEKAEAERKARERAERLARQKNEQERLARAKIESERREREEPPGTITQEYKKRELGKAMPPSQTKPARLLLPIGFAGGVIIVLLLCGYAAINLLGGFPTAVPPPAATEAPATEAPAIPETELPTESPTPLPPFSGKSLEAPNCDYGGIINAIEAVDRYTVVFSLCRPEPAFLSKIAMEYFAIYPEEWLEATIGNGTRTSDGLESPVGTGPYMPSEWNRGDNLVFVANSNYWGDAPKTEALVFRWASDSSQRLVGLQAGEVDGIDSVNPDDLGIVSSNPDVSVNIRPSLNTSFLGMNNTFAPFDDQRVRQAIAMGIDRQGIVDNYYPFGTEVASHFVPCYIQNGCVGDEWYDFDPETARALLAEAGYPDGFSVKLSYRDVFRSYLPRAGDVAQEIQYQLRENLNINVELNAMSSGTFIQQLINGQLDGLYLYGWFADYPHPTSFMSSLFAETTKYFGVQSPTYYEKLTEAAQLANPDQIKSLYVDANNAIQEYVPMIPIAHVGSGIAYRADVANQPANALSAETFAAVDPNNRDTFTWMQTSEPISLFCADEWEYDTLRACAQVMEPLYSYASTGTEAVPALAEKCEPVDDQTWVCTLRQGVTFHDGTTFDANDVITTFTMGLDASSPLHVGNTNEWSYYDYMWGLMNKPQ